MDGLNAIAVIPHIWIVPLVAVAILGGAFVLRSKGKRDAVVKTALDKERYRHITVSPEKWTDTGAGVIGVFMFVVAFVVAAIWLALLVPYNPKYLAFYQTTGTVTDVTNTLIDASGELTAYPIVTIDSLDIPVEVTDPRVLKTVGEEVTLTCSWSWVPYGRDRLSCFIAD